MSSANTNSNTSGNNSAVFDLVVSEEELKNELDEKVNEILIKYQEKLGIMTGDADPFLVLDLDSREGDLAKTMKSVLENQYQGIISG